MKKKLTKHGNSLVLIIDKPLLQMLNISEKTNLELSIEDGKLIVSPGRKKRSNQDLDDIADRIMDKYKDVFEKLSKT